MCRRKPCNIAARRPRNGRAAAETAGTHEQVSLKTAQHGAGAPAGAWPQAALESDQEDCVIVSAVSILIKQDTWALIKRLVMENARDKWKNFAFAFALLTVVSAATGATAYMMKDVVNEIFVARRSEMIWVIAGAIVLIYTAKGAASYWNAIILARTGNAIVARLQRRMYKKLLEQDLTFFTRNQLGDLLIVFQAAVQNVSGAINTLILSIGRDIFSLIALISVMVIQDPWMSAASLLIGPPAVIGVMHLMRKVKDVARSEFKSLGVLMTQIKETVLGFRVIKSFRLEGRMRGDMDETVAAVERLGNNMARLDALTVPLMETLGGVAVAIVVVYGGWRVIGTGQDPGAFFSFITALLLAYDPARRLARFNVQFQQNMMGVGMVYRLLDEAASPAERDSGRTLEVREGRIVLENVTFTYAPDAERRSALEGISLEAVPGGVTALVGPSGGGKSTIFALLSRLYLPQQGRVLIDGQDIAECSVGSVRSAAALVSQDTFLFETTIRENLRMGRLDATDEEIEAAARAAHAHEFILEQPQGYDTQVGEGGGRLSGGQRQRISIARAMLADAPILLLDEATSALDSESEAKVQEAMERLKGGRTTLVIAHRLSTVRHADCIHVIERGRVSESGKHEVLLTRGGHYARLHEMQFRGNLETQQMAGEAEHAGAALRDEPARRAVWAG
jgi:ATP-binding cassette, subfamily B, bacterial MsbA